MPDWSYRTVLRPLLFALPPSAAQRLSTTLLARLAHTPGGPGLIDFLGHMRADSRLARRIAGQSISGPMGLGSLTDPEGRASRAFARFGAGFLEIGPVTCGAAVAPVWRRAPATSTLHLLNRPRANAEQVSARLAAGPLVQTALWFRIAADEAEPARVVKILQPWAAGFSLEVGDAAGLAARVEEALGATGSPLLLSIAADQELTTTAGAHGVWVRGELSATAGGSTHGPAVLPHVLACLRALRALDEPPALVIAGGVSEPEDVRQLEAAGAQLYAVDAGLVFSGPGLIKRCNEALLHEATRGQERAPEQLSLRAARRSWFWALCLGAAMLVGGLLALAVANTRVVLPYDESLCGLSRAQLTAVNPRLLPFMRHDRVTLAGTMLSIGILYSALALHAVRRGAHWAQVTVIASALTGFASLFYFLGFGYFDPFHAFVSSILFQFLLLCVLCELGEPAPPLHAEWRETAAWRRAQWGQLLFVVTGIALIGAGLVISYIGFGDVFVREDLEFMRTTAAELLVPHERLVPLVAHDRATLGGMLLANGIAILLFALWGFRAGERWLWRALAWAGAVAFGCAIGVHYVVGYDSLYHLAPAFAGLLVWLVALWLTRRWLMSAPSEPQRHA